MVRRRASPKIFCGDLSLEIENSKKKLLPSPHGERSQAEGEGYMRYLLLAVIPLLMTVLTGCPRPPAPPPLPPPQPGVGVVNMIPASLSGETNQDSEPFLAAHPTDPQRMAG